MKGSFTGALRPNRDGRFGQADKGTLFLDEIGDMPLALQAKILRVLQARTVRAGGLDPEQDDGRTHHRGDQRDLEAKVRAALSAGPLYRLNVFPSPCPRCGSAGKTCPCPRSLPRRVRRRAGRRGLRLTPEASRPSPPMASPETFASSRTASSARSSRPEAVIDVADLPPYLNQRPSHRRRGDPQLPDQARRGSRALRAQPNSGRAAADPGRPGPCGRPPRHHRTQPLAPGQKARHQRHPSRRLAGMIVETLLKSRSPSGAARILVGHLLLGAGAALR